MKKSPKQNFIARHFNDLKLIKVEFFTASESNQARQRARVGAASGISPNTESVGRVAANAADRTAAPREAKNLTFTEFYELQSVVFIWYIASQQMPNLL